MMYRIAFYATYSLFWKEGRNEGEEVSQEQRFKAKIDGQSDTFMYIP